MNETQKKRNEAQREVASIHPYLKYVKQNRNETQGISKYFAKKAIKLQKEIQTKKNRNSAHNFLRKIANKQKTKRTMPKPVTRGVMKTRKEVELKKTITKAHNYLTNTGKLSLFRKENRNIAQAYLTKIGKNAINRKKEISNFLARDKNLFREKIDKCKSDIEKLSVLWEHTSTKSTYEELVKKIDTLEEIIKKYEAMIENIKKTNELRDEKMEEGYQELLDDFLSCQKKYDELDENFNLLHKSYDQLFKTYTKLHDDVSKIME